jgi:DNA-binding NtrC family response regulator
MKGGATEFLLKPFDEDDLVRVIDAAIAFDRRERERERERAEEGSYSNKRAGAQHKSAEGAELSAECQSSFLLSFCAAMAERGR